MDGKLSEQTRVFGIPALNSGDPCQNDEVLAFMRLPWHYDNKNILINLLLPSN